MVDVGYVSLELGECQLVFKEDPVPEGESLSLRVDLELLQEGDSFTWQMNGSKLLSSETLLPFRIPNEDEPPKNPPTESEDGENAEDAPAEISNPDIIYSVGLNNFFKRTEYIDLNNDKLAALTCTTIKVSIREADDGADTAEAKPSLCEIMVPISSVLMSGGGSISNKSSIEITEVGKEKALQAANSFMSYILTTDNDMTEFCLGCGIFKWNSAKIEAPPTIWTLKYEDVVDPKAKVPPTEEDQRTAYLEAIANLVNTQDDVVAYTLEIGRPIENISAPVEGETSEQNGVDSENDEDVGARESETTSIEKRTPLPYTLLTGNIEFDKEAASTVDVTEDIRSRTDLWTLDFTGSKAIFLHRSQLRDLASSLSSNASVSSMTATLRKSPTESGASTQGEEIVASGTLDLTCMLSPGLTESSLNISDLVGAGFGAPPKSASADEAVDGGVNEVEIAADEAKTNEDTVAATPATNLSGVQISFSISNPVVAAKPSIADIDTKVSDISSGRSIRYSPERDVLKELKDEISDCVRKIAIEYVSKYPVQDPSDISTAKGDGDVNAKRLEDKKVEFLHYLSSNGVYHRLKEGLKPRIQRVFRSEFGVRGQAKGGKTPAYKQEGTDVKVHEVATTDQILAELYVYLVKVCNQVLNKLYSSTVIEKDTGDVDQGATLDDEEESSRQILSRLLSQSIDAEADGRSADAEQRLLERLQIVKNTQGLTNDSSIEFDVYHKLAEFYLRQASVSIANTLLVATGNEMDTSLSNKYISRARETLTACTELEPTEWKARQELACLFAEAGLTRETEDTMIKVINDQITSKATLGSFGSEFDGYESDSISHVDPQSYAILAAHFSRIGLPLKARKCLRLATKAYVEMNVQPAVEMHGSPRRTPVLILAKAAIWLSSCGFTKLAAECVALATQCEMSTDMKAKAKNLNSVTPPFIRHALKRAVVEVGLISQGSENLEETARDSVTCAEDAEDIINGWLCVAKTSRGAVTDSLLSAIEAGNGHGLLKNIPLACHLEAIKQLVALGRFHDALSVALNSAKIYYTSSSLMLQVGIISLRLSQVEDAERAFREANLLDNRNCEVWAYQCLVCLQGGPMREEEATAALHQTLRLGLASPSILRELAVGFMASDKLQVAEELIRRSLAAEGGKGSVTTRKLLGDVLAGQNLAAKAVEEYKSVLESAGVESDSGSPKVQLAAAERCVFLLQSLGREEEAKSASAIAFKIRSTL